MTNLLVDWFVETLSFMPKEAVAFTISMIPILELRGGLIVASLFDIEVFKAITLCIIGNILPIPFILLFITPIFSRMKKTQIFKPMVEKLEAKSIAKSGNIKKYEFWGLALFVGIPLPGTGAWTGTLIAALLGIKLKKASLAILTGIMMAATIMTMISYGIPLIIRLIA